MDVTSGGAGTRIDLSPYARYLLVRRVRYRGLVGIIAAFFAVLAAYVLVGVPSGSPPALAPELLGALLAAISAALLYLTFRIGIGDPISSIEIQSDSLRIILVSGTELRLPWDHPNFRLTFFDASQDTHSNRVEQQTIVLRVDQVTPVYGGVSTPDFELLVRASLAHGLTRTSAERVLGKGSSPTRVTITEVGPASAAGSPGSASP